MDDDLTRALELRPEPLAVHDLRARSNGQSAEIAPLALMTVILRYRRITIMAPLVLAIIVGGWAITRPKSYTSTASFTPRASGTNRSALTGLAAQFGIGMVGGDPSESPDFFGDLVTSQEILAPIVTDTFRVEPSSPPTSLAAIYGIDRPTSALARDRAISRLARSISVERSSKTGVITVAVSAPSATLARDIGQRLLASLDAFNLRTRRDRAASEMQFADERLQALLGELRAAEGQLLEFQRHNRAVAGSPDLMAENERLEREVTMRQQLYMSMSQLYEQARLDATRNTPVITVLQQPEAAAKPDSRRTVAKTALALVLGAAVGFAIAVWLEMLARARSAQPESYATFERELAGLIPLRRRTRTGAA